MVGSERRQRGRTRGTIDHHGPSPVTTAADLQLYHTSNIAFRHTTQYLSKQESCWLVSLPPHSSQRSSIIVLNLLGLSSRSAVSSSCLPVMSSTPSPADVVHELLRSPTDPAVVHRLVASDCTYVSLNDQPGDLKKIMPWAGRSSGPQAILDTFTRVGQYWSMDAFRIEHTLTTDNNVAAFGHFTYTSTLLHKTVTSPFSILCTVKGEQIVFMQFMEDTFGTAQTFKASGQSTFRSDPNGTEVHI